MENNQLATCRKCTAQLPSGAVFCHICGVRQQRVDRKPRTRPNGSGTAYKRGKTWTARVVAGWKTIEQNGKPHRTPVWKTKGGFATKREALEHCTLMQKSLNVDKKTLPLSHYWALYSENAMQKLSESTQQAYQIAYNKLPDLHIMPIHQIGVKTMQDAINTATPTHDTAKDARSLLSNLFQLAIYDGAVSVNAAQALTLPESNYMEAEPFNDQEIAAVWTSYGAGNGFAGVVLLMIYTGMMPIEILRLEKHHIDWENKVIIGVGAKTKKRKDTPIVLADVIIPVLSDLCSRAERERVVDMSNGKFYREFYTTVRGAGCRESLTPYSCRHTTATALEIHAKAPPSVIAEVLRQKTVTMQRRYIHPETQNAIDAVNQIPSNNA